MSLWSWRFLLRFRFKPEFCNHRVTSKSVGIKHIACTQTNAWTSAPKFCMKRCDRHQETKPGECKFSSDIDSGQTSCHHVASPCVHLTLLTPFQRLRPCITVPLAYTHTAARTTTMRVASSNHRAPTQKTTRMLRPHAGPGQRAFLARRRRGVVHPLSRGGRVVGRSGRVETCFKKLSSQLPNTSSIHCRFGPLLLFSGLCGQGSTAAPLQRRRTVGAAVATDLANPTLAILIQPIFAKPILAKPTLAKVRVLVVQKGGTQFQPRQFHSTMTASSNIFHPTFFIQHFFIQNNVVQNKPIIPLGSFFFAGRAGAPCKQV